MFEAFVFVEVGRSVIYIVFERAIFLLESLSILDRRLRSLKDDAYPSAWVMENALVVGGEGWQSVGRFITREKPV